MKRGSKAFVVGVVVFIVLNVGFFVFPPIVIGILKPFISLFSWMLESKVYSKLIGSEYHEVVTLSIIISVIIGILSYFLMPDKNEK